METKYLKIGLGLIISIILIFLLVKFLLPKKPLPPPPPPPPPIEILSPEEIAIKYLELEQGKNRQEAEKYLFSDFSRVEILRENYQEIRYLSLGIWPGGRTTSLPEFKTIDSQIGEKEANIKIEETTNRGEGTNFFKFLLPPKLIFEVNLVKEGDYWKITKIDSQDLILETKLGQKVKIKENIFIKTIKIGTYQSKNIKPKEGFKFLSLEVEYENKSNNVINFSPLSEWRLMAEDNKNQVVFSPTLSLTSGREVEVKESSNLPLEIKLTPNEIKTGPLFFEIPKEYQPTEVIFKNLDKKVMFGID